ncbi:MAG: hypothetical protein AAGI30_00130 [Planctomycetota bacterium]
MRTKGVVGVVAVLLGVPLVQASVIGAAVSQDAADDLFVTEQIDNPGDLNPLQHMFRIESAPRVFDSSPLGTNVPRGMADFSGTSNPADTVGIIRTTTDGRLFGVYDTNAGAAPGFGQSRTLAASWTFDVSSTSGPLDVSVEMAATGQFDAADDFPNFDGADSFSFTYQFDTGPVLDLFTFDIITGSFTHTTEGGNTETFTTTIEVNGATILDNVFQVLQSAPLVGSGSTLTVGFAANTDPGFFDQEAFAFRNIEVSVVPAQSVGVVLLPVGIMATRRRAY